MKDVMLDIETLGTRPTSAIVQIGACYFDRNTGEIGETFSMNIEYPDGEGFAPFTIDLSTINWWDEQSQEAKNAVFKDGHPVREVIEKFAVFLKGADHLWSHATFDAPIVANAFAILGMKMPVHYKGMRDIRTLMDLADHHSEKPREGIHHNALDDCKFQVGYVVEALNKLKS